MLPVLWFQKHQLLLALLGIPTSLLIVASYSKVRLFSSVPTVVVGSPFYICACDRLLQVLCRYCRHVFE